MIKFFRKMFVFIHFFSSLDIFSHVKIITTIKTITFLSNFFNLKIMEKYEAINQTYYDRLNSSKRYPEAKLNLESPNESGLRYLIEEGLVYYYFENYFLKSNKKLSIDRQYNDFSSKKIVLAGGYFTQYVDSSPIAHAFPQLYDYFKKKQDIDIWITLESEQDYHLSKRIGILNIITTVCNTPADLFDFECCKIWCRPFSKTNEIHAAKTLLDSTIVINNEPTFTQAYSGTKINGSFYKKSCDCEGNLRKLKYLFKNCYNIANSENEIKIAKNIFNTKKCPICERNYLG
jgi:hypothetical protein